jgi:hypothetical protein
MFRKLKWPEDHVQNGDTCPLNRVKAKDHIFFHECFHGDNGRGVGASHQTGWSGFIAKLLNHAHWT